MDPKRSLTKFKTDKKLRRKRTDSQSSLPCLTEPNQPNKDSFRCSELPALSTERTSVDPVKVQKTVKEKEACALDYLRGMSDEESSQNEIERKMTNFDEDLDPLDTSDRLSPFFNATKRHTMHRENSLLLPSSTQMKFAKEIKPVVGKSGEGKRKGVGKRIHSDPDEKVRTKVTKSQSCQFTFYELPPKGAVNKVNIGTNFYEDTKGYRRTNSISERTIQNVMTEPDYQDITVPTQENYPKEVEIVMHTDHSSSSKGPSVLQIRRLIGNNYSHILHEMREYKENGIIKDMKSTNRVNHDKLEPGLTSSRKLYYPKEKRPPVPSSFRYGPNNIVLVGRGVPGLNNYGEFDTRKLSIEDTRERRKTSFSDHGDSKEMPYKDEVLKGMRSVSSAGTSRKNLRGDSEAGNITLSRCSRLRTPLNEVQNFKEDNSVFITRATNESPTCVTERESKGDVQVGFWFKAKKNLLNPPSPERESSMQEKGLYRGLNLPRKRETCKENKVLLDKVSQVYKFKMGNVTQQNGNLLSERSEITRAIHNIKDLNLFKKDQRVSSSLNRKKSFRENFSIDMKGLDGKAPKLRAILEVLQKELKGDRPSTPAKGRPNNTAENKPIKSDRARKGLDNLTNLLNMKGSEVKLRPSRFE